jgi:LPXTG-site transpeptidase (sortase) family protein
MRITASRALDMSLVPLFRGSLVNCVIAAHRNCLRLLVSTKSINCGPAHRYTAHTRPKAFDYQIISVRTTHDSDISVLHPPPPDEPPRLTLLTCTVPRTTNRIVLVAQLVPPAETY